MNAQRDAPPTSILMPPDPLADRPLWAAALRAILTEASPETRQEWTDPATIVAILNRLTATDIGRIVIGSGTTWALSGARLDSEAPSARLWLRGGAEGTEDALEQPVLSYLPHPRLLGESLFVLRGRLDGTDPDAGPIGVLIGYHSATLPALRLRHWQFAPVRDVDADAVARDLANEITHLVGEGPADPPPEDDPLEAAVVSFARHRGDRPPGPLDQADVDVIAAALLAQGEQPTMEAVRRVAGGGSNTTIHPKLKAFYRKEGPQRFGQPVDSDPLAAQVKTLLDQFVEQARTIAMTSLRPQKEELVIGQRALGAGLEALTADRVALAEERTILAREEVQRQRLIDHLAEQLSAAQAAERQLATTLGETRQRMAAQDAERARWRATAEGAQTALDQLTHSHAEVRDALAQTRAALVGAEERAGMLQAELVVERERMHAEREAAAAAAQRREADLTDARAQRDQRATEVSGLRERLERAERELTVLHTENSRLNGLEATAQTQSELAAQLTGELRAVTAECDRLRAAASLPDDAG